MVATRSKKGKDAVAVQVPPWSYVDEESARDRLIDPVTKNSQPAVMNIIFLLCGAYSLYFLVANVLIPLAGNGSPSPSPHWVVIAAAAGCFASCMYAVYPVLLPNPSYTPPGHGPFARVGAESRLESLQRLLIIVNPVSGKRKGLQIANDVAVPMFNKAGIEVVVTPTKEARHAFEMARTLPIADYDAMVVIGGDGTIHEVLNGMLARDDGATVPVGLIPQGTGNSMAMDYKYVVNLEDPEEAVRVIIGGFAPSSDLNLVTFGPHPTGQKVWSCNLVGFGSDQCAASMNIKEWEPLLGNARYDICALWGLLKGQLMKIKLTIDGKVVAPATSTFWITHTQHFGRGMRGSCEAYWDDGVFDCSAPQQLSAARLIQIFNGVKGGGWNKHVTPYFRGKEALFEFPTHEGLVNIDGEVMRYEGGKVKVECVPKVVRFFAPQC